MTKEEAIQTIKIAIGEVEWDYPMDYAVAFEMAIEALKEQKEQELSDVCYECTGYGDDYYENEKGELVSSCYGCWVAKAREALNEQ